MSASDEELSVPDIVVVQEAASRRRKGNRNGSPPPSKPRARSPDMDGGDEVDVERRGRSENTSFLNTFCLLLLVLQNPWMHLVFVQDDQRPKKRVYPLIRSYLTRASGEPVDVDFRIGRWYNRQLEHAKNKIIPAIIKEGNMTQIWKIFVELKTDALELPTDLLIYFPTLPEFTSLNRTFCTATAFKKLKELDKKKEAGQIKKEKKNEEEARKKAAKAEKENKKREEKEKEKHAKAAQIAPVHQEQSIVSKLRNFLRK